MTPDIIGFGDIIRYREEFYVYLVGTESHLYLAKILPVADSKRVIKLFNKAVATNKYEKVKEHLIYCFVILSTSEFEGRVAHLANTGRDFALMGIEKLEVSLCKEDIEQLKEEIVRDNTSIPRELIELTQKIFNKG